jgi:hypothetical protein
MACKLALIIGGILAHGVVVVVDGADIIYIDTRTSQIE